MSCGAGRRPGSDPALLWLWSRLVAAALIGPLAWEPPYVADMALKRKKKKLKTFALQRIPLKKKRQGIHGATKLQEIQHTEVLCLG